jgi:hypothetical protein
MVGKVDIEVSYGVELARLGRGKLSVDSVTRFRDDRIKRCLDG